MIPHAHIKVLSGREMLRIHEAALRILQKTGLEFGNTEGLSILRDKSVRVDMDRQRVYLEPEAVMETIRQFAGVKRLVLTEAGVEHPGQERRLADRLEADFGSNHGFLYNLDSRRIEPVDFNAGRRIIQLKRALPGVTFGCPGFVLQNVPQEVASVHTAALGAKYGPCMGGPGVSHPAEMKWISRVMQAAGLWTQDQEHFESPVVLSPLKLSGYLADSVVEQARRGRLVRVFTAPTKGASAPVTIAGDLTLRVAETFGFNTVSRLLCAPACEFFRPVQNSDATSMDMRSASLSAFGPELLLMTAAYVQMLGDFYKAPVQIPIYLMSNATHPDVQSGMERVSAALMRLLLGACATREETVVGGVGIGVVSRNQALSLEQCVIDHAYFKILQRWLEGIRVSGETIAADVIDAVGPGGTFLAEEHTLQNHAADTWYSDVFQLEEYEQWIARGCRDVLDIARQRVAEIGREAPAPAIPEDRVQAVDQVVREAERAILGRETGLIS